MEVSQLVGSECIRRIALSTKYWLRKGDEVVGNHDCRVNAS
jgi:hypothetical protein